MGTQESSEQKVAGAMGLDEVVQKICGMGTTSSQDGALGVPEGQTKEKEEKDRLLKEEPETRGETSREGEMKVEGAERIKKREWGDEWCKRPTELHK